MESTINSCADLNQQSSTVSESQLSDGTTSTLAPQPKVLGCQHAKQKWNAFFTYGHCEDCRVQLKANGRGGWQTLTGLEFEREKCEVAFRSSKYMHVVNCPESFAVYWDGWKTAKDL